MNTAITDYRNLSEDYYLVEEALKYLEEHYLEQPTLQEIAASVGFSEFHFQRLFTRWVGISPKRFLQFLTKEHAKQLLEDSESVLSTAYQTGLSSPARLHDLFVSCEAVTPGQYKSRGMGMTIWYGRHETPFGRCLLALSERGLCGVYFLSSEDTQEALHDLRKRWVQARLVEAPDRTTPFVRRIFPLSDEEISAPLNLFLSGTNFQIKVWEALLRIPPGRFVTYGDIAKFVGKPGASRAVGQAVGENPLSVIIPCHRVIRKMGVFGGYRWGTPRKMAIHGWEMSRVSA